MAGRKPAGFYRLAARAACRASSAAEAPAGFRLARRAASTVRSSCRRWPSRLPTRRCRLRHRRRRDGGSADGTYGVVRRRRSLAGTADCFFSFPRRASAGCRTLRSCSPSLGCSHFLFLSLWSLPRRERERERERRRRRYALKAPARPLRLCAGVPSSFSSPRAAGFTATRANAKRAGNARRVFCARPVLQHRTVAYWGRRSHTTGGGGVRFRPLALKCRRSFRLACCSRSLGWFRCGPSSGTRVRVFETAASAPPFSLARAPSVLGLSEGVRVRAPAKLARTIVIGSGGDY